MNIRQSCNALSGAAMLMAGIGFGAWLLAATPAGALNDNRQILSGGTSMSEGNTFHTSPGLNASFDSNYPAGG